MKWVFVEDAEKNHNALIGPCTVFPIGMLLPKSCFSYTGKVHMPSGKTAQPEIVDNKDGTVTVKYAPTEAGLHEMHIKYNGSHIPGKTARERLGASLVTSFCG